MWEIALPTPLRIDAPVCGSRVILLVVHSLCVDRVTLLLVTSSRRQTAVLSYQSSLSGQWSVVISVVITQWSCPLLHVSCVTGGMRAGLIVAAGAEQFPICSDSTRIS